ncbi:MAG: formylglycine-generating enzyme family protein [Fibrobacter sp.]|nr:formylglycine-generating enzyme family protein [Fibrobacter sp.]
MKIKAVLVFMIIAYSLSFSASYSMFDVSGKYLGNTNNKDLNGHLSGVRPPIYFKKNYNGDNEFSKSKIQVTPEVTEFFESEAKWIEIEKNTALLVCLPERKLGKWLLTAGVNGFVQNEQCFQISGMEKTGSYQVLFWEDGHRYTYTINVAVGMKYIDLSRQKHKIGSHKSGYSRKSNYFWVDENGESISELNEKNRVYFDPESIVNMDKKLLVDKYLVTNCDFLEVMKDSIPEKLHISYKKRNIYYSDWVERKDKYKNKCDVHDTAAEIIHLYSAFVYANLRSVKDGLQPVYSFNNFESDKQIVPRLLEDGSHVVIKRSFLEKDDIQREVKVYVDTNSDGYRLPFYEEWMVLARAGDTSNFDAYWQNESEAREYAWFGEGDFWSRGSKPVGILKPNAFGLYDILGLVCENTMFSNEIMLGRYSPYVCKGGMLSDSLNSLNIHNYKFGCEVSSGCVLRQNIRLVRKLK